MSPPKLIIDLNRCFEPSPFNTGPPIPTPLQNLSDMFLPAYGSSVPDLTASPTSSCGSSLQSFSLEDEDIRKIFAPQIQNDLSQSVDNTYTPTEINCFTSKEELNPHAAPFIPSFDRSSPPAKLVPIDLSFQPSPLDLGFEPINFAIPTLSAQDQSPGTQYSPHHDCIPLPPRSAPLQYFGLTESDEREPPITLEAPLQSSPVYLPLFTEAFHPKTPDRLRKVLAHAIVNVCPTNWELETLLDLAKRISVEACKPATDNQGNAELPIFPCDPARYKLGDTSPQAQDNTQEDSSSASPEIALADISLYLYTHFASISEEMGQAFGWNLRESILRTFISYWDSRTENAISFKKPPTVEVVRSALAVCKSIGALFTRNLITHQHISMCISILMKNLMSVEHVEALADLVLSAGPTFWKTHDSTPELDVETASDSGVLPLTDGSLLFSTKSNPAETRASQSSHVMHFLRCLSDNISWNDLKEDESVVNMGWATGQFSARVMQLIGTINRWESTVNAK